MPRYYRGTKTPCPGCGQVDSTRPASEVCSDCKTLLANAAKWEKQLSKVPKDEVVISFGEAYHWNQYLHTRDSKSSEALMRQFHKLCKAATIRETPTKNVKYEFTLMGKMDQTDWTSPKYVMSRELAEAIRDMYALLQPAIDAIYQKGKDDGHNLLMRLASGDLAPNEYMDKTK